MRSNITMNAIAKTSVLASALLLAGIAQGATIDVYLEAQAYSKDLLGTVDTADDVPMWRYVCTTEDANCANTAHSARITVAEGDNVTIHVANTLPVETSLIIPGQMAADAGTLTAAEFFTDGQGRSRVKSFTHQAPAAGSSDYVFNGVRAGTYLYQSGTYPSIEVPMGLYGAFVVTDPATVVACVSGQPAYDDADSCHDADVVLLFSEVDPAQNIAVAAAGGTVASWPSTVNYAPNVLLVNGATSDTPPALPATGGDVLLRMLNAGSRSHTPAIVGKDMRIVAEDGNVYPGEPLTQAQALVPAGKTRDAVVTLPAGDNTFVVFDRTPDFTNDELVQLGGVASSIDTGAGATPAVPNFVAGDDVYDVPEDCGSDCTMPWSSPSSVLINDCAAGNTPPCADLAGPPEILFDVKNGTLVMAADGTFTYAPSADFSGADGFTYKVVDGADTYSAHVTLNVSFENDAPVAVEDGPYTNNLGTTIVASGAQGLLGNDIDVDGDYLEARVVDCTSGAPATVTGLDLSTDGTFVYTGGASTSFCYQAVDEDDVASNTVTVALEYQEPADISLTVLDADDETTEITSYRWLVQEDVGFRIDPDDTTAVPVLDQQSLNFHKSTYPIIAQGCQGCPPDVDVDPNDDFPNPAAGDVDHNGNGVFDASNDTPFNAAVLDFSNDPVTGLPKQYYVSVLPNSAGASDVTGTLGHTIGGAQVMSTDTAINVYVNRQEIELAQISVLVFEDGAPTNGVPDASEPGLGGFEIYLEDAGGRYGASAGTMFQDAFGAPLRNSLDCFGGAPQPEGVILTCPDGSALIKDLPPGKYGVFVVPPAAEINDWIQTSTIEGTKVIDTWVKAGEPPFFVEFGLPGPHAFVGFVNPTHTCIGSAPCQVAPGTGPATSNSFTGHVTLAHDPRPPAAPGTVDSGSYVGFSHTRAVVGLNTIAGDGPSIATVFADDTGTFSFSGIPDGTYQVVIFDTYLDQVIAFETVTLPLAAGATDIGNVPVPAWFTRIENNVFLDANENGILDDGELPLSEQNVNIRWRDGTVFQTFPTDLEGFVPFDQVFPFFNWQVMEIDYARMKPTGLTVTVDAGGDVSGGPYPGLLNPQLQSEGCTDASCLSRTETGPVLTQAFQGFPGQTSIFDWGKKPWTRGENGGISGIVFYGITRGEGNPQLTVGDVWERGIADVTVRLYREIQRNPADVDIDVDLTDGPFPQPGDTDRNGNGIYEGPTTLKLVNEAQTDNWEKNLPEGCPGEDLTNDFTTQTLGLQNATRCYDGWRNWNQARPGVFDGGYAFNEDFDGNPLTPGNYVVEVVLPPGYELIKEQDMNVGFGDSYGPDKTLAAVSVTLPNGMLGTVIPDQAMIADAKAQNFPVGIAQPECVGNYQLVPAELSLFPGEPAPYADSWRPLCDRKRVKLMDQAQGAADFHLFTSTPAAAQFTGLITDDLSNETNTASPNYGEKWTPAFLPFALRDEKGRQVYRGHSDAFGHYNGLVASTFTANIPIPSGYSPAMYSTCLNDPGDGLTPDKLRLNGYGTPCYTLQYMPAATTYLDTPILPTAAFAAGFNPVDCAMPARTPTIASVTGPGGVGPYVPAAGGTLTIRSHGTIEIANPDYEGPLGTEPATIMRDLGFGSGGSVTLNNTALTVTSWTDTEILATVPAGLANGAYQLNVTRVELGTGTTKSVNAVTVTKGGSGTVRTVTAGGSIQAVIDAASAGDLILVGAGVYEELVVLPKPLRLQGVGTDTVIMAAKRPPEKVQAWIDRVQGLFNSGAVDPLPNQVDFTLPTEQGAGITVLAKNSSAWSPGRSRIDGFSITAAELGGGIYVNGYADNLEISNNNIYGNSGYAHGGIRIGQPYLAPVGNGPFAFNTGIRIHNNSITSNGAYFFESAGGGISINRGTDNYVVSSNYICGNYTAGDGAGIGHLGFSDNGLIQYNTIVFNQSLNNSFTQSGGGIAIAGEPGEPPALTLGAGDVVIDANLIQGNHAASGHGGGIRAQLVNGQDVEASGNRNNWHSLRITNNMIVDNVAGWSGGGISLQDAVNATIVLNTVANNDSTSTVGATIGAGGTSSAQPAGISSELNSLGLNGAINGNSKHKVFSNPVQFSHNIIWHNRAFSFDGNQLLPVLAPTAAGQCAAGADYWDLGVLDPAPGRVFDAIRNILTSTSSHGFTYPSNGSNANSTADPQLVDPYCNGSRVLRTPGPMLATAAFAEGGNFVDVRYGPLTRAWDEALPSPSDDAPWHYHIGASSPAINLGPNGSGNQPTGAWVNHDFDNQLRPRPVGSNQERAKRDAGADEYYP